MTTADDAIAAWVRRLNALGDDLDADAAALHPSAWHEAMEEKREKWEKLARKGGEHGEI
jgi:glutathione S-transferase